MRHVYECPLRWADMDMLGHVNNVTYVDYLQEARIDMLETHAPVRGGEELAEGVVVVRHVVEFAAPLVFRPQPVRVDVWVSEIRAASFTMAYEVYDEPSEPGGERTVYLRATSVLAPFRFEDERPRRISAPEREVLERFLEDLEPARPLQLEGDGATRHVYPLKVRWSDVDAYRHVNNVTYFEYLQEARIQYFSVLRESDHAGEEWGAHVVARTDMAYRRPILFRLEPYAVHSWVSRLGSGSFTISSEILDGDELLASGAVVMVPFDPEAGRSAPMGDAQRALLQAELTPGGAPSR